jgi:hypothetical protein
MPEWHCGMVQRGFAVRRAVQPVQWMGTYNSAAVLGNALAVPSWMDVRQGIHDQSSAIFPSDLSYACQDVTSPHSTVYR